MIEVGEDLGLPPEALETLWIDGEKIGKVKKHVVELEPGEHEIKAKLGKKLVTQRLAPKAGATYLLRFDAKRKKAVLKKK
jgi:hypothetical protein